MASKTPESLDALVAQLERLPGIGPRSAARLAHHLLRVPESEALDLADAIRRARARIRPCASCHAPSETDPCPLCADPARDRSVLLVVETPRDLGAFEAGGTYRGLYFVLGARLSPLEGVDASALDLEGLAARAALAEVAEVCLGTNPDLEGDGTALTVTAALRGIQHGGRPRITRLARGLDVGRDSVGVAIRTCESARRICLGASSSTFLRCRHTSTRPTCVCRDGTADGRVGRVRLELGLNLKLSQQLRLAPQIIQSIEILQLPAMDLRELIENELQENEALEVIEPAPDSYTENGTERSASQEDDGSFEDDAERVLERLDGLASAERTTGQYTSRGAAQEASDRKLEAMQNAPADDSGLSDHLVHQLEELELDPDVRTAAEAIVYNLADTGLLPCSLSEVSQGMDVILTPEVMNVALQVVQSLDPRGVGARDLQECLLLQIRDECADAEMKRALLRDHYDDLKRNKLPRIARSLGIDMDRLYDVLHGLASLSTRPGATFSAGPIRYIRPDVVIEWDDGNYAVRLVNDHLPRVGLSHNVRRMLEQSRGDPKVREYLKRKIDSAKWLIEAIAQRQSTLDRVVKEIVVRQRDYMDFGVNHLRPLKMQEVADILGIHVSTVSRAISDKHAQTPRGIVPLKFFFTGGTENEDGGIESRLSVKERVRDLIEEEDKHSPLSDDEVAERLKDRFGLDIARRTVTKYRKALNIPSSRQRRLWS